MSSKNVSDIARIADFATRLIEGLKYKSIQLNDQKVEYLEAGKGPVIVFIHGFGGINAQWRYWLAHFKANHRVVAVTIPDLTLTLNYSRQHYSFRSYAHWLGQFLDAIHVKEFHLVGHCTGGCISAFYASQHPQRVQSLTLIAPPEIRESDGLTVLNTFDGRGLVESLQAGSGIRAALDQAFYRPPKVPMFLLSKVAARIAANLANIKFVLSELSRNSGILLKRLPLIETPTLIIGGEDDLFLSSLDVLHYLQEKIKISELVILPECGHFPLYEQQERCVELVEQHIARSLIPVGLYSA